MSLSGRAQAHPQAPHGPLQAFVRGKPDESRDHLSNHLFNVCQASVLAM